MRRDQRFDQCPQLIRHQPPRQLINHEPRSCPQPNQDPNETRSKFTTAEEEDLNRNGGHGINAMPEGMANDNR